MQQERKPSSSKCCPVPNRSFDPPSRFDICQVRGTEIHMLLIVRGGCEGPAEGGSSLYVDGRGGYSMLERGIAACEGIPGG